MVYVALYGKLQDNSIIFLQGKIEGKAGRGRPRTPFMKRIIEDIGRTTDEELKEAVMDRDECGGPSKSLNQSKD